MPQGRLRSRRAALAGMAAGLVGGVAAAALPGLRAAIARPAHAGPLSAALPEEVLLMVAGPSHGETASWAGVLAPALARGLPPGTRVGQEMVGGTDGVTGANHFEALAANDGTTALLLPGSAALAWLVGDPRARYDASAWVPALAAVSPGVLVCRRGLDAVRGGHTVRLAASTPAGPELPALLALELLGARVAPVFGLTDEAGITDAVLSGAADAAYLHGRRLRDGLRAFAAAGVYPVLSMGAADESQPGRDPLPGVPSLVEIVAGRGHLPLAAAWRATAAATQTEAALVLPQLTPTAAVSLWRRGCAHAAAVQDVQDASAELGARAAPQYGTGFAAVDPATLHVLRGWLAERWRWRPA